MILGNAIRAGGIHNNNNTTLGCSIFVMHRWRIWSDVCVYIASGDLWFWGVSQHFSSQWWFEFVTVRAWNFAYGISLGIWRRLSPTISKSLHFVSLCTVFDFVDISCVLFRLKTACWLADRWLWKIRSFSKTESRMVGWRQYSPSECWSFTLLVMCLF